MDEQSGTSGALGQFTIDLTAEARAGRLDPVLERDQEIHQLIDILLRRRQNNPILVGDPRVGKIAIVEGLASRVANGDVPPNLKPASIRSLARSGIAVSGRFCSRGV